MIDLPYSSRCRMAGCPARSIRNALCLQHLRQLAGPGKLPPPADLPPMERRERRADARQLSKA